MPTLTYGNPPPLHTLVCPNPECAGHAGGERHFTEYAYVAASQPVSVQAGEPGSEVFDSFDYGEHHVHLILCQECEATVWEAPAPAGHFEVQSDHPPSARWFETEEGNRYAYDTLEEARAAITEALEGGASWNGMPVTGPFHIYRVSDDEEKVEDVPAVTPEVPGG